VLEHDVDWSAAQLAALYESLHSGRRRAPGPERSVPRAE
jgi:hypothetical protein